MDNMNINIPTIPCVTAAIAKLVDNDEKNLQLVFQAVGSAVGRVVAKAKDANKGYETDSTAKVGLSRPKDQNEKAKVTISTKEIASGAESNPALRLFYVINQFATMRKFGLDPAVVELPVDLATWIRTSFGQPLKKDAPKKDAPKGKAKAEANGTHTNGTHKPQGVETLVNAAEANGTR